LIGAFVPVRLRDPGTLEAGIEHALRVARLLAAVVPEGDRRHGPFIVVADDNVTDPGRTLHAGRITLEMALPEEEWAGYAGRAESVARAVREETGLRSVFHPHSAGWVETPAETDRFLAETDPEMLGIVFDTGHYLFGAGDEGPSVVEAMDRWADRIWYIHFKDNDRELARRSRAEGWDYLQALRAGIFSELGKGGVDFRAVVRWLDEHGYDGWAVVEQDILPGMGTPKESARRNREFLTSLGI
jgi:inosose dehydratase